MAKKKPPKNKASHRVPTGSTPSRSIASNSSTKASTEPASAVANQTSFVAALPEIPAPLSSTAPGGATEVDLQISVPDSSTAAVASLPKDVTVERENPSMVSHQAVAANLLSPETCANKMESPKAVILATVSNPSSVPTVSVDNNRVPILAISAVTGGSPPSSSDQLGGSQEQLQQRKSSADIWKGFVKPTKLKLQPKETPYTLESGEACVTIPNAVVEKNKKAWECFILGQFYEEAPPRGAVHAIVNGIWSKQRRDISVSKMEGNAFLLRVPCPNARRRILSQPLWQIDGQTMFVAKWAPGLQQVKPELEMVPVWLEFTGVPLQFFNEDALQEIAGIVGHPVCLHPSTANLTNIEVAKVYTVIDPRKPIPKFVNARFESGDTRRIGVSSPWLPSLCSYCKKVGHSISRCKAAPKTCALCNSVKHPTSACPRGQGVPVKDKGKAPIKSLLPITPKRKKLKTVYREVLKSVPPVSSNHPPSLPAAAPLEHHAGQSEFPLGALKPPRADIASTSKTPSNELSKITVHDLSTGSLCVDLSGTFETSLTSQSSGSGDSTSDMDSLTEEEENPEDKFIEVFAKRYKQRQKAKARARGPLIL
nr:unnamed protein product [Brassica rapa]